MHGILETVLQKKQMDKHATLPDMQIKNVLQDIVIKPQTNVLHPLQQQLQLDQHSLFYMKTEIAQLQIPIAINHYHVLAMSVLNSGNQLQLKPVFLQMEQEIAIQD